MNLKKTNSSLLQNDTTIDTGPELHQREKPDHQSREAGSEGTWILCARQTSA